MARRLATTIALAALPVLAAPVAAQGALPKIGFYCGGTKDAAGMCQLGINVYKFKGKTLVTAATRIANTEFTCSPSGTKGKGTLVNKIFLGGMALKKSGAFSGREKPPIGPPTLTVTGRFTTATEVDVTFDKRFVPVGERGDNCSIKKRITVTLKKQRTSKGLF